MTNDELLAELKARLKNGTTFQADVLKAMGEAAAESSDSWAIAEARFETDDELEVDDLPLLSVADDGVWVSAWIWVPRPEED